MLNANCNSKIFSFECDPRKLSLYVHFNYLKLCILCLFCRIIHYVIKIQSYMTARVVIINRNNMTMMKFKLLYVITSIPRHVVLIYLQDAFSLTTITSGKLFSTPIYTLTYMLYLHIIL